MKQTVVPLKTKLEKILELNKKSDNYLLLYNDDINSFDYVIESLIKICNHHVEQAEQCTLIAHYKGKCEVKKGAYNDLLPYKNSLTERGLIVSIK